MVVVKVCCCCFFFFFSFFFFFLGGGCGDKNQEVPNKFPKLHSLSEYARTTGVSGDEF